MVNNLATLFISLALITVPSAADTLIYAYNSGGQHRIHLLDLDTSDEKIVSPENGAAWNAAFHPNGKQIIYTLQGESDSQVYVADLNGDNAQQLTFDPQYAFHPSFSPDGKQIVYSRLSERQLILMNADGTDARVIADDPSYDAFPVFFSDGKRILFHSRRLESPESDPGIFIFHMETGAVVHTGLYGTYAYPSPDGSKIVLAGKRNADADRDVMIADTQDPSTLTPLTEGGGYDGHPSFTADGKRIIFVSRMAQDPSFPVADESDTAGTNEVFMMNIDGTDVRQLTHGGAVAWHPLVR